MTEQPPVIDPSEVKPASADRAITVRLADVKPERVDWLWPGRLLRGKVVLLDGDPDKGKSRRVRGAPRGRGGRGQDGRGLTGSGASMSPGGRRAIRRAPEAA